MGYAFCQRFPDELTSEIFEHILNKALNNRMLDPSAIFIDGTHIKASANKKKFQKEQVAKAAKVYSGQLRREVNEEREKLGKKPIEDEDDENHPQGGGSQETAEKTVSTTDPDCGMFVKGEHERQFAYEAHTACDKHGFVLGVEVTSGNVSDSVAWDAVYDKVTDRFPEVKFVTMDAGYKTPWIAKKVIEDSRIPILPYNINVNCVCPGVVRTNIWERALDDIRRQGGDAEAYFQSRLQDIPLKRAQTMEDVARMFLYLSSDFADNMTGQSINITGGKIMH